MQQERERLRNIENNQIALDLMEKKANIKEKLMESKLAALKAVGNQNVSEEQTVKG